MRDWMQHWICRENIRQFRGQLAESRDDIKKRMLMRLLAEEEAKLERLAGTNAIGDKVEV